MDMDDVVVFGPKQHSSDWNDLYDGMLTCITAHAEATGFCTHDYLCKVRSVVSGENPDECRRREEVESRERELPTFQIPPSPCSLSPHPSPQVRIAMGTCQTQASCFCDLFICCNQSLLLPRLPNSCRDKEMGLCFQRLDDLCWCPSRAGYPDHFPKPRVGLGRGRADNQLLFRWQGWSS